MTPNTNGFQPEENNSSRPSWDIRDMITLVSTGFLAANAFVELTKFDNDRELGLVKSKENLHENVKNRRTMSLQEAILKKDSKAIKENLDIREEYVEEALLNQESVKEVNSNLENQGLLLPDERVVNSFTGVAAFTKTYIPYLSNSLFTIKKEKVNLNSFSSPIASVSEDSQSSQQTQSNQQEGVQAVEPTPIREFTYVDRQLTFFTFALILITVSTIYGFIYKPLIERGQNIIRGWLGLTNKKMTEEIDINFFDLYNKNQKPAVPIGGKATNPTTSPSDSNKRQENIAQGFPWLSEAESLHYGQTVGAMEILEQYNKKTLTFVQAQFLLENKCQLNSEEIEILLFSEKEK